jgi:hypothetical protein
MSATTLARDLVITQTRALKLPGVARTLEALVKRAMRIGRMRIISMRSSPPSRRRAMSPSFASGSARRAFLR